MKNEQDTTDIGNVFNVQLKMQLLTRDEFREEVFYRDKGKCVVPGCGEDAVDAHHIIERRLWQDKSEFGGYYLDNGASLCEKHHRMAEEGIILPQVLRYWLRVKKLEPINFDPEKEYEKWGEEIELPNRIFIKYPSTPYFEFSKTKDYNDSNRKEYNVCYTLWLRDYFGALFIPTIKMDGSNVQLTREYVAARNSLDATHDSFDMLKAIHHKIKHLIPENIQVFGEWLYAKHSIHYIEDLALDNYLQIFGVYDTSSRIFLGWDEVKFVANRLGCITVPAFDPVSFKSYHSLKAGITKKAEEVIAQGHEGLCIRIAYPYHYSQHEHFTGKYVRQNHVQTGIHWKNNKIIKNDLKV